MSTPAQTARKRTTGAFTRDFGKLFVVVAATIVCTNLGTAMALMAMVLCVGTFVVWAPMAAFLALNGDWVRALILAGCGVYVIAVIDNLIYPMLVGNRLRQHTVITFLAIVGGIALFGGTGIILGPVVVSLTFFLLEVWRTRTAAGHPAEYA
jgi:predicted PurR-regulated permease PerM